MEAPDSARGQVFNCPSCGKPSSAGGHFGAAVPLHAGLWKAIYPRGYAKDPDELRLIQAAISYGVAGGLWRFTIQLAVVSVCVVVVLLVLAAILSQY